MSFQKWSRSISNTVNLIQSKGVSSVRGRSVPSSQSLREEASLRSSSRHSEFFRSNSSDREVVISGRELTVEDFEDLPRDTIGICLNRCTSKAWKRISECLSHIPVLKLTLRECALRDQHVSQLSYALRKLKELRIGNSLTYSEQPWSKRPDGSMPKDHHEGSKRTRTFRVLDRSNKHLYG
jgi:hypothetical protein